MRPLHTLLVVAALAVVGLGGCGGRTLPPPRSPGGPSPTAAPVPSPTRSVTGPVGSRPDLSITVVAESCVARPEADVLRVRYSYEVAWTHDPPFRSFAVRTTGVDGTARDTAQELPWPAGQSVRTDTVVDIAPERLGRDVRMRFVLDPRNEIPERDERNNAATLVLTLPAELPHEPVQAPLACAAG